MTARETFGFGGVGREMNGLDLVWFWSLGGDGFRDMHLVAVAIANRKMLKYKHIKTESKRVREKVISRLPQSWDLHLRQKEEHPRPFLLQLDHQLHRLGTSLL